MVTYSQLIEWIAKELVLKSLAISTTLAWFERHYEGIVEAYFEKLEDLMVQFPTDSYTAHVLACKPFGDDLVIRIIAIDEERGGAGITLPQLQRQRQGYVSQSPLKTSSLHAVTTVPTQILPSKKRLATCWHCWICEDQQHRWPQCPKQKIKG